MSGKRKVSALYGNSHNKKRGVSIAFGVGQKGVKTTNQQTLQRAVTSAMLKNVEKKGCDTNLQQAAVTAALDNNQNAFVLNLVQQGSGSWNRVGRQIKLDSLRVRGFAVWISDLEITTFNLVCNSLRMTVVWDKQPSGGTIPVWDNIFGCTQQDGTEFVMQNSPVKYDQMERYQVLRDTIIDFKPQVYNSAANLTSPGTQNNTQYCVTFDEYIKLGGRSTTFLGQSAPMTNADISTGSLYIYFRALAETASTNVIFIDEAMARLRYYDM